MLTENHCHSTTEGIHFLTSHYMLACVTKHRIWYKDRMVNIVTMYMAITQRHKEEFLNCPYYICEHKLCFN